jgi:hypothetical protein
MRLNFAGSPEEEIREGVRRIGRAAREQLGLLGSLSGRPQAGIGPERRTSDAEASSPLADVVSLHRRDGETAARRRRDR